MAASGPARRGRAALAAAARLALTARLALVAKLAAGAALVLVAGAAQPAAAPSADAPQANPGSARELAARRQRLDDLRRRVDALKRQIETAEASRGEAADALRESEQAISATNRRLFEGRQAASALAAEIGRLDRDVAARRRRLEEELALLGRLAIRQAVGGRRDALRIALAGGDPNAAARRLHYLRHINGARADAIARLRDELARLDGASRDLHSRREQLAELDREQVRQRRALQADRDRHSAMLARIAQDVARQRRGLASLERDEARLAKLVEQLARIIEQARRSAARAAARSNERLGEPERGSGATGAFASRKGALSLPVPGELANRFGGPRHGGGPAWKGIFIRCAAGTLVKAVDGGQVVYADWLRGFGNLMIVDHGDGYMSLYGNNESLLKAVGSEVRAGEAIAMAGNSGGVPESGLYFEIRHQGRAIDPLDWVAR